MPLLWGRPLPVGAPEFEQVEGRFIHWFHQCHPYFWVCGSRACEFVEGAGWVLDQVQDDEVGGLVFPGVAVGNSGAWEMVVVGGWIPPLPPQGQALWGGMTKRTILWIAFCFFGLSPGSPPTRGQAPLGVTSLGVCESRSCHPGHAGLVMVWGGVWKL